MRSQAKLYEQTLRCVGEGICSVDVVGNVTFVNDKAASLLGWSTEEVLGQNLHTLVHDRSCDAALVPGARCPIVTVYEDGAEYFSAETIFWTKSGNELPVEYTSCSLKDASGRVIGAVLV